MKYRFLLVMVMILAGPLSTFAATYYVDEHYGDNANAPCKKVTPCETLEFVVGIADRNSRIYLAPGTYYPSSTLNITQDGIRIYSLAGRDVTTIESSADPIFSITGNKFTLGAPGRGLTVRGTAGDGVNQDAIEISGIKPKLENNRIVQTDSGLFPKTNFALSLYDGVGSATIRNNSIFGWEFGIHSSQPGTTTRHLITNNELSAIGDDCIDLTAAAGNADKIIGNKISFCQYNSIPYDGILLSLGTEKTSRPKIEGNSFTSTSEAINVANGSPTIKQNLVDFSDTGIRVTGTDKAKIQDNFIWVGTGETIGIDFGGGNTRATVTGNSTRFINTAISIGNPTESPFQKISGNNFDGSINGNECPIALAGNDYTAKPIKMSKNHWGQFAAFNDFPNLNAPGCPSFPSTNAFQADANGTLLFDPRPLNMPNAIKFKGGPDA